MRWIKHMAGASDDEKIANLIDKGGLAAYGLYWRVNEIIASRMEGPDPSCSVRYSIAKWSRLLGIRGTNVERQLRNLGATGVATIERHGDDIVATNRNLLKYRDEYSKKSGHTPESVPSRTDTEAEGEQKKIKKEKKTLASSPNGPPAVFEFPTLEDQVFGVPENLYRSYQSAYPAISVMDQFNKMHSWLLSNPTERKTPGGMPRFMNRWLAKAQNEKPTHRGNGNGNGNHQVAYAASEVQRAIRNAGAIEDPNHSSNGTARHDPAPAIAGRSSGRMVADAQPLLPGGFGDGF